jgi:hypothetical protein
MMGILEPNERTLTSGVTSLARTIGWADSYSLAGMLMQIVILATPLFVGAAIKIA